MSCFETYRRHDGLLWALRSTDSCKRYLETHATEGAGLSHVVVGGAIAWSLPQLATVGKCRCLRIAKGPTL